MTEHNSRATGRSRTVAGETFYQFATGILKTEWRTLDKSVCVGANGSNGSYWASVNGNVIGRRYRKLENAMRDGVRTRNLLARHAGQVEKRT